MEARAGMSALSASRLVFFGTPDFAVPTLEALCDAGRRPLLVVSQPARPVGRGRRQRQPPVAARAAELGLAVAQPERLSEVYERLEQVGPEVAVVVAYGKIFRRRLLRLPRHGCMNLHASLLPSYRGAAPVQAAIAAGERRTGVTTMWMERGLDSGPILLQREVEIGRDETAPELSRRLAVAGAGLVVATLEALEAGSLAPQPQDDSAASWAPLLRKEDGRVDWELAAARIYDRFRAYTPWPGSSAELAGRPVKLLGCRPSPEAAGEAAPGVVVGIDGPWLLVACGDATVLAIDRLQRPGRGPVSGDAFAHGERLEPGDRFA